jgi:hypothetical protein
MERKLTSSKICLYILSISILIKFIGITLPPLEVSHHWRQALTNMVALNFHEFGPDIMHPNDRFSGSAPGLAPMEFPTLPFLIWMVSKISHAFHDWYGRLIVLLFSVASLFSLYKTIKHFFDTEQALLTSIILSFSLWMPFSRKVMPDILSFSLMLIAIHNFYLGLEKKHITRFILFALTFAVSLLTKISAIIYLPCFLFMLYAAELNWGHKLTLAAGLFSLVIPALYWYFIYVPELALQNPTGHFFMGKRITEGFTELLNDPLGLLKRLFITPMHYVAGALFIAFIFTPGKNALAAKLLLATLLLLFPLILKTGMHFIHHDYYVLPLVPFLSLCAASIIFHMRNSLWRWTIIIAICIEGCIHFYPDLKIHHDMRTLENLSAKLDRLKINSPVAINGGLNPCAMFYTGRYGWSLCNKELMDPSNQKVLQKENCTAIIILRKTFEKEIQLGGDLIYIDENVLIKAIKKNDF